MSQLSLIPEFETQHVFEKAQGLFDALNDGLKRKEMYKYEGYCAINDLFLFVVSKDKNLLFNILDKSGNMPENFSSCWRSLQHIKHELNSY